MRPERCLQRSKIFSCCEAQGRVAGTALRRARLHAAFRHSRGLRCEDRNRAGDLINDNAAAACDIRHDRGTEGAELVLHLSADRLSQLLGPFPRGRPAK